MRIRTRWAALRLAPLLSLLAVIPAAPCFAQGEPATRPASSTTEADYFQDSIPYFQRMLGDLYANAGMKDPRWDAAAAAFLKNMATHFAGQSVRSYYRPADLPSTEALLKAGNDVLALGCDDPLVCYSVAELYDQLNRRTDAKAMYHRASSKRRLNDLSAALGLRVTSRMVAIGATMDFSKGSQVSSLAAGPLDSTSRRQRLRLIKDAKKPPVWFADLVNAIDGLPNHDPWLRDMLAGRMHIDMAWAARGSGWANTVTEEGWKGFFANLTQARTCFLRAHKLAPELPEAAVEMIVVAMGGSDRLNEDPVKWFDLAIAAQPDFRPAYAQVMSALQPRWGGSYEKMIAIGLKCLENPRYDTLIPFQFISTVAMIGEDIGDDWTLLSTPKVYELVGQVLDNYAKKCGPGRGNYFASGRIAIAIRTDRLDEARKLQDDWKKAGGQLDWKAFEYFDIDDGPTAASMSYAYTGAAKADLARMDELIAAEKEPEALAVARAAKSRLVADDPAHLFVDGFINRLANQAQYRAGEWVPLPTELSAWKQAEGGWYTDENGGLISVTPAFNKPKSLIYIGDLPLDPDAGFEISVVVEGALEWSDPQPGRGIGPRAGIAFYSMKPPHYRGWVNVELAKTVGEFTFGKSTSRFDIPPNKKHEMTVRCKDHELTVYLNGKKVGDPVVLPDEYRQDLHVGLGGSNGPSIRFSKPRVRNLTRIAE